MPGLFNTAHLVQRRKRALEALQDMTIVRCGAISLASN